MRVSWEGLEEGNGLERKEKEGTVITFKSKHKKMKLLFLLYMDIKKKKRNSVGKGAGHQA